MTTITLDVDLAARWAAAVRQAHIELGEVVIVVGEGHLAQLTAQLAHVAGAATVRQISPEQTANETPNCADVLIYAAADWQALGEALRLVRDRGRVLALNASAAAIDFNLYPDLHRRSLQMIGAAIPDAAPDTMVRLAQHLIETGRIG
jgi:threonine dehydrogenase-like Zn-dependent dehydrogenase